MKNKAFAVDLHIHSCLSPCGDEDMTPNNIVNMALLKGLDVISVTDHNSGANLPAVDALAREANLGFLPGIEVNTKEEIHVLAYLPNLERAMELDEIIMKRLPKIPNNEKFFGAQLILNEEDECIGKIGDLLINAVDLSLGDLKTLVEKMEGAILPAHIDKKSFSLIANLGFIPPDLHLRSVELSSNYKQGDNTLMDSMIKDLRIFRSSDAHYLHQMLERSFFLHLKEKDPMEVIQKIRGSES
ncbi:PHP domain-containing protein [Alkalibacter rhizosphaerae]|uniref:PHP domain-containing protein n=1 Tax=Alkalibacter rhizosphaerae TaxID=2815577 RepID=A0A974XDR8_9FIRM|nr:PHP domain-containing protein [Alkalibacter rhizosphaerae]QSX07977.1 PHP domain-containing protein [Alkalibacter rhizosphaerae]